MELQFSHYVAFTAFLQLAVALNFGLVYLDRKSGLLSLKRRLFHRISASNSHQVEKASNILKRYRSGKNYPALIERAHTKTKQYHSIVVSDWNDEYELSFFPALGVIFGLYSLTLLFLICFFDIPEESLYYNNQFLVLSQVTTTISIVLILCSLCIKSQEIRIIPTTLVYIFLSIMGWVFCHYGLTFKSDMNFIRHFHWYILLAYLPIFYYMIRIIFIRIRKWLYILPMVWWASIFDDELNKQQQS